MIPGEIQAAGPEAEEPQVVQLRFDDLVIDLARYQVLLKCLPLYFRDHDGPAMPEGGISVENGKPVPPATQYGTSGTRGAV